MSTTTARRTRTTADPGDAKRDRLAERLRRLRRRLDDPDRQADVDAWELDLYSYDESLIVAADLLDVDVPKGARDEMTGEQRTQLEDGLAAAGLDVRAADDAA